MKSATLPKAEDKRIVRNALPSSNIFTAAVARLYIALPGDRLWKYSGLWGAIAFCKDRKKNNSYFIRLIDIEADQGVIWEQELYQDFDYVKDCPFFHTFETDDYLAGILFVHQGEADVFYDKVIDRENIKLKDRVQKNDVGRVSYIPGKGFTVEGNDPEVLEILRELEKLEDFSAADIDQNQEFIQDFIRQYRSTTPKKSKRGPPPPPPPSRNRSINNSNRSTPPPIPPMMNRQNPISSSTPPPPPVPNRGMRQTAPPPPPPSFPAKNSPIPSHASAFGGPPPPPPPPPSGAPVPPPPSPPSGAPIPPPPPSAPIGSLSSPGGDSRSNLMAAIRSTGGFGSLKKGGSVRNASPAHHSSATRSASMNTNSKPDMASSLAAVLRQRKSAMQSDDEDEDDDDDWK